jgi:hypothetical protein
MTELKTLKDIDLIVRYCPRSEEDNLVQYMESERKMRLKEEAIKWYKKIGGDCEQTNYYKGQLDFIESFFDITEDEING